MKPNIHPIYYSNAKIVCACGNKWIVGSTVSEIHVNVCFKCHPFYTGTEKIIDTRGRVEKFQKRVTGAKKPTAKKLRGKK